MGSCVYSYVLRDTIWHGMHIRIHVVQVQENLILNTECQFCFERWCYDIVTSSKQDMKT